MWPISGNGSWFRAQHAFGVEIFIVLFGDTEVRSGGSGWVSWGSAGVDWVLKSTSRCRCWVAYGSKAFSAMCFSLLRVKCELPPLAFQCHFSSPDDTAVLTLNTTSLSNLWSPVKMRIVGDARRGCRK